MTTTLTPAAGSAPLWTQQGAGASPGYAALDDRRAASAGLQAGVSGATDFQVVQRGAGANMSVDVTMPVTGLAWVLGAAISGQGLYAVPAHSATVNEIVVAAHATLPRIDKVYVRIFDNVHDGTGLNRAETVVSTGTPTASASLTNLLGAVALSGSVLLLADVLVPAASSSVVTANIQDRRSWARGAYRAITSSATGTTFATSSVDAGVYGNVAVECTGVPLRIDLFQRIGTNTVNALATAGVALDGTPLAEGNVVTPAGGGTYYTVSVGVVAAPAAGRRVVTTFGRTSAGNGNHAGPSTLVVQEVVRQNAGN